MDAISPEYRLDPSSGGSFTWSEWQIDDDHELAFHQPTGAAFLHLPRRRRHRSRDPQHLANARPPRPRLRRFCRAADLPALAASAIIAFAYMSFQMLPVELRAYHPACAADRFRAIVDPG
jgi:hypothetical protein